MKKFCKRHPIFAFALLILIINVINLLLFFAYYPLMANHSAFAKVLYYFMQTYSAVVTFATLGAIYTACKLKSFRYSLIYILISSAMMLIPNTVSSAMTYSGYNYYIAIATAESVGISVEYAAVFVILCSVMYRFEKGEEPSPPSVFAYNTGADKGCVVSSVIILVFRLIFEISETIEHVYNRFGMIYFFDAIDIVLSYLFVIFTVFVSYISLVFTRRFLLRTYSNA